MNYTIIRDRSEQRIYVYIYRISLISLHADSQSNYARSNRGRELIKARPIISAVSIHYGACMFNFNYKTEH